MGIREYVIVDRFDRTVLVLTYQPEGYAEQWLRDGDTYSTPLLPELEIALTEVLPPIDQG